MSVKAGIDVLTAKGGDSMLVLGDMGELGADAKSLHAEVGRYAKHAGVQQLFAVGELSRAAVDAFGTGAQWFADKSQLAAALVQCLGADSVVLVKGSRAMQMETLIDSLRDNATAPEVN